MLMRMEHANITAAKRFLKIAFPEFEVRGTSTSRNDEHSKRWEHFGTHERYLALEQLEPSGSTIGRRIEIRVSTISGSWWRIFGLYVIGSLGRAIEPVM